MKGYGVLNIVFNYADSRVRIGTYFTCFIIFLIQQQKLSITICVTVKLLPRIWITISFQNYDPLHQDPDLRAGRHEAQHGGGGLAQQLAQEGRRWHASFLSMLVINVHTKGSQSSELIKIRFLF